MGGGRRFRGEVGLFYNNGMKTVLRPWHKLATPREEVRGGRSFNPDEFAINLSQVVSGKGPSDYVRPEAFFARTSFTSALVEHAGAVFRRLSGDTKAPPVMTLMTQFGGGKTHTLTALWHLSQAGADAGKYEGVGKLLSTAGLSAASQAAAAVFVGTAWDPRSGSETPWLDIARQLAGDDGVSALGLSAQETPPGTDALQKVFRLAGRPCLILVDEALNYINRHREGAEKFHAFLQNLTVAALGAERTAVMLSLPRSSVELTPWDVEWQGKIERVVRRVAKDLIVTDQGDVADVVRRRLFSDLGEARERGRISRAHAQWCLKNRDALPRERVSHSADKLAVEGLAHDFDLCYPFHPSTLSVFQRKWQGLPQYQQTRGTLAMLAQWVSRAYDAAFRNDGGDSLITLGSAPLEARDFRSVVLGQLGENRLQAALDADLCGANSHASSLDADTRGAQRGIHRRAGAAIFFESSGGQRDKVASLPELRYAVGGPGVETASVDDAVFKLEKRAYYLRRSGESAYKIHFAPTMRKIVNDRRASLDEEERILPRMREVVRKEFEKGPGNAELSFFPMDGAAVADAPRLTLAVLDPRWEWDSDVRRLLSEWTVRRDSSPRLYPGALVWCVKKRGQDLREKAAWSLAWEDVRRDLAQGALGTEISEEDKREIERNCREELEAAREEVWSSYRFAVLADGGEEDGVKHLDLGVGHSSSGRNLRERILAAMRGLGLLNETVGVGYLTRNWPPALLESGEWPLSVLRKSFLDGALTRLPDPDVILRRVLPEYVSDGRFGLAVGKDSEGGYMRVYYGEPVGSEEIEFVGDVFLLTKSRAEALKSPPVAGLSESGRASSSAEGGGLMGGESVLVGDGFSDGGESLLAGEEEGVGLGDESDMKVFRISGDIPPDSWNRVGLKLLSKFRGQRAELLSARASFRVRTKGASSAVLLREWTRALEDLGLSEKIRITPEEDE